MTTARDYAALLSRVSRCDTRQAAMQAFVDAAWPLLGVGWGGGGGGGVSWLGFYLIAHDRTRGDEMLLGPRRDKPACSPIGMHGACGRCYLTRRPLVVSDVANLGKGYIACDPRDRSEVVLPVFNADESCWGVLDLDSFEVGAFSEADVHGLQRALEAAGLTTPRQWVGRVEVV